MVEEGIPGAERVKSLKDDPHRLLVTILVGNNIVNIAMSSLATGLLAVLSLAGQAVAVSTFGITAIVLLLAKPPIQIVDKPDPGRCASLSRSRPPSRCCFRSSSCSTTSRARQPVTGGRSAIETSYVTRDEIQDLIETGEREGVLDEDEREMLDRIFRFNSTIAKEVMTPRLDMTAVPKDATIDEAIETCVQADHERVPVYEGSSTTSSASSTSATSFADLNYGDSRPAHGLDDLVEPTLHVPESKNVDELLSEMRDKRMHMVVVIDEFGTTEGLITMEDMAEEIVGEILEGDEEEPFESSTRHLLVRGEVNIDEVNEMLDIELPEGEEFETLAGFIFNRAGRLVEEGETSATTASTSASSRSTTRAS